MNENKGPTMASHPDGGSRGSVRLGIAIALLFATVAGGIMGIRSLSAATNAKISVNPPSQSELWYKPTPITITINTSNFSGAGQTPISGYQYGLRWDPTVLKWLSGPNVGPGTPTVQPILPCAQQIVTWGTATATPTNFVPTYTPTYTNTPLTTTPTNTATATYTPSLTPTPGGYIFVGCATISNATPVPAGVIGTFKFQPIATAQSGSSLSLINVKVVDHNGATVVPMVTAVGGNVLLASCNDVNSDGSVNIIDLSLVASHFLASNGQPNYVLAYDVNKDNQINIIDLSLVSAAFLLTC